jgi:hypothetical protein
MAREPPIVARGSKFFFKIIFNKYLDTKISPIYLDINKKKKHNERIKKTLEKSLVDFVFKDNKVMLLVLKNKET